MNVQSPRWLPGLGFCVVALLYVTSLFLPSLSVSTINQRLLDRLTSEVEMRLPGGGSAKINADSIQGPRTIELRGYDCFRESFSFGSNGLPILVWCANPLVWIGAFCLATRRFLLARLAAVPAMALALVALVVPYVGRSDADVYWSLHDYRIGYWCWLASAVALAVFGFAGRRERSIAAQKLSQEIAT
jgi:hypothetical protein